ncbi:MAG: hypothetical protein QW688_08405 [Thermoprotei archaeon]
MIEKSTVAPLRLKSSIFLGLLGGLIGSLIMGGLGYLVTTPKYATPFYVAPFMSIGLRGHSAYVVGWLLNIVIGLILGAAYATAASGVSGMHAHRPSRGIPWGLAMGVVSWLVYGLPAISSGVGLDHPLLVGAVLVFALVYGAILGAVYSVAASRMVSTFKAREQTVSSKAS